jgi:hypothetical protein
MQRGNWGLRDSNCRSFLKLAAATLLVAGFVASSCRAQQQGQKTFATPEDASKALYAAAQSNDEKALLELLGPEGKEIVSSGNEAEDAQMRANFVKRYEEMNRLVKEPDGTVCLYIGPHNWPYPIPMVNKGGAWYFDTVAGKKEILFRRIGRNEISAIHICKQLADAEKEYYAQHNEYAPKIFSDEGKSNGLYWNAGEGQPKSPIGPLVANAVLDDNAANRGTAMPFRGYYFHALKGQGKNAAGGAKSYTVNGKATGFAFVAYPAEYRSSGVKTFLVSTDGVIYEKDLGEKTEAIAKSLQEFNPAAGWQKTQVEMQAASEATAKKQ